MPSRPSQPQFSTESVSSELSRLTRDSDSSRSGPRRIRLGRLVSDSAESLNHAALRFPLFRRQLRTKQLQQQFTPELRRDYATLFSFTFITCDATQHGQLWTVADFPAWNPYKSVPLIAIVQQINMCKSCSYEAPAPLVILPTAQSSRKPRPPTNKRI